VKREHYVTVVAIDCARVVEPDVGGVLEVEVDVDVRPPPRPGRRMLTGLAASETELGVCGDVDRVASCAGVTDASIHVTEDAGL